MIRGVVFDMYETLITHYHGKSPLYFSPQMAAEAGVPLLRFQEIWRGKECERTIGKMTLEETLTKILKENTGMDGEEIEQKVAQLTEKRIMTATDCFRNLHPEILPMLEELKQRNIKIGLISNCFSEEAKVIHESVLAPYFDVMCLSYELGMRKPEPEIYAECARRLGIKASECLYVGDGGSSELEAASAFGMTALQAVWYLCGREDWPMKRKAEFEQAECPMDVLRRID